MVSAKENKLRILDALEGDKAKTIWRNLEKIYGKLPEETKDTFFGCMNFDNKYMKDERYLIVEDYNLQDDFYCRSYKEKGDCWGDKYEDYFDNDTDSCEEVLVIDMKEMKFYKLSKEVNYPMKKIKIKEND